MSDDDQLGIQLPGFSTPNFKKDIDAPSFLADVREKLPSAKNYPDDMLLDIIKKNPQTIEQHFPGFSSRVNDFNFVTTPDNPENLLQRTIKQSRMGPMGGTSILAGVPSNKEEGMDLLKVIGRTVPGFVGINTRGGDVGMSNMGPVGIGLNMAGINKMAPIVPAPNTEYGKNLEMTADVAPWAALGLEGATALSKPTGKGIGAFFDALKGKGIPEAESTAMRTQKNINLANETASNAKVNLATTDEQLSNIKAKELAHEKQSASELPAQANDESAQLVKDKFLSAKNNYNSMLEKIDPSKVKDTDLIDVINKIVEEKGIDANDPLLPKEERNLLNLKSKMESSLPKATNTGILDANGSPIIKEASDSSISDPIRFKKFSNAAFDATGDRTDLQGSLLNHLDRTLTDKGITEFQSANSEYHDAYEMAKAAKQLKSSLYAKAAKGELPPTVAKKILESEGKLGVKQLQKIIDDHISRSQEYGNQKNEIYNKQSELSKQYEENKKAAELMSDRLSDLNSMIKQMKSKRNYARTGTFGAGTILATKLGVPGTGILKHIVEAIL